MNFSGPAQISIQEVKWPSQEQKWPRDGALKPLSDPPTRSNNLHSQKMVYVALFYGNGLLVYKLNAELYHEIVI